MNKNTHVTFRINAEQKATIQEAAEKAGVSMSEYFTQAALDRVEADKAGKTMEAVAAKRTLSGIRSKMARAGLLEEGESP